ncbi:hypothetical protein [Sorangium sp. So ce204]|uniref:hypothetical protein n=1 Tax=Sorangium sp. So ce204 TaxID=3133288 RepID=UPI003F5DBD71
MDKLASSHVENKNQFRLSAEFRLSRARRNRRAMGSRQEFRRAIPFISLDLTRAKGPHDDLPDIESYVHFHSWRTICDM